jgi:hypothetical protein
MKKTLLKEIKEMNKIAGTKLTKEQEISFIKNRLNELSNYTENDIDTGMDIISTVSKKNFSNNDALDAIEVGLNSLYGDSKTQDMIKNWEKQYTKMGFAGNSLLSRESLRAVVAGLVSMHGEDKVKKLIKGWESDYSKKYM